MKKALLALAISVLCASGSFAATTTTPVIPGVKATDWNNDGIFAKTGSGAVFLDSANGLLWSNTTIDRGTTRSFDEATNLLLTYNSSRSIEGVSTWVLPTKKQFELLFATQGPDTVTNNGMEKRVFDYFGTYVWTQSQGPAGSHSHFAFAANSSSGSASQFIAFDDSMRLGVWAVTPVPEPETYAMLLAGLGMIGAVAARRKAK